MRTPPMPQVCFVPLCVLLVLITGCSNPSSQTLASLTVTATPSTVSVGSSAVLKAVAHLSDGTTQDVTSATQWTLSNPAVATMTNTALVAKAPGTVTVQAAYLEATPAGTSPSAANASPENLSASAQVTITAASSNAATISWSAPTAITYGTALGTTQLNATASVPGTFTYTPAAGTVLKAGTQTLSVTFTPNDTSTYSAATVTVQLTVNQATPAITWGPLAPIAQGTALGSAELDATANVPGVFVYNPAAGNVPGTGTLQLTAAFTPTDTTDYTSATANNSLVVSTPGSGPTNATGSICTTLSSGASQSTIQSALNSCGSGNTVAFSSGTYGPISSTVKIPCGVSMAGPAVPYSQTPNQTATINGSSSFAGPGFQSSTGCSATTTIQYLVWNGNLPANGGGFIKLNAGTTNYVIENNWLYGANSVNPNKGPNAYASQVYLCCLGVGGAVNKNITIQYNIFGSLHMSDCNTVMNDNSSSESNNGGFCNGVGMGGNEENVTVQYNIFHFLEQGTKVYSGPCCEANPVYIQYNDYNNNHRNDNETQANYGGSLPTLMYIDYNSWHTHWSGTTFVGYGTSSANGCQYPSRQSPTNCVTHTDFNVFVQEVPGVYANAIEQWGGQGTTASYNLMQGNIPDGIQLAANGEFSDNNNTFESPAFGGNPVSCANITWGNGLFNSEGDLTDTPTCTGNTTSTTVQPVTSVAPSISPNGGTFSGSQTVTITNPGTNRDTNTTDWCTTDGTTPIPGSGTAVGYHNGGTITVTGNTTVKCVGMWGALNQPYSYASGYGYAPSAVVSSSFTPAVAPARAGRVNAIPTASQTDGSTSGQPATSLNSETLQSVTITPSKPVVSIGATTQLKAIATFSDGSTKDVSTSFAWASSDTRNVNVSSTGLLSGVATGNATISGSYLGMAATISATSSIGAINWSGPIVITSGGTYSGNWQSADGASPAVTVATNAAVVIENAHIRGGAGLVKTTVNGADLTIRNSVGVALNPAAKGQANGVFLETTSPVHLDVENNYIENAGSGVVVHGYSGNRDGQQTIVIRSNRARNLNGLLSDGKGGYLPAATTRAASRFIELDNVQAVPGIDLGWNEVINYPGLSLVADNIDVRNSGGTANQPTEIHDTFLMGQDAYTGGGIKTESTLGAGAEAAPAFNNIHDNQVVGAVSYGIEFAGGHDNVAANNRIISSKLESDGTRITVPSAGMVNVDSTNTMHDNIVGWNCWTCSYSGYRKDQYFPASPGDYSNNVVLPQSPTNQSAAQEYQFWMNKMASSGILVGPSF